MNPNKRREEISSKENIDVSAYTMIVQALLKAGANLANTSSGLNPRAVPDNVKQPNTCVLKILMAAGAEIEGTEALMADYRLQGIARECIRKHLLQIQPAKNLFHTIPQLGLPYRLQSYLLAYTLPKNEQALSNGEKDFLSKTSAEDIEGVRHLIEDRVKVDIQDENGMTALMIASQTGNVHLVEELIKAGASVNIQVI